MRFFDAQNTPGLKGKRAPLRFTSVTGWGSSSGARWPAQILVEGFSDGERSWAIERQRYDPRGRKVSYRASMSKSALSSAPMASI